jgi:hypothetical protein
MVGHTAWHWMTERADQLRQFPWPAFDAAMLAGALRWLMALVALAGLVWVVDGIIERRLRRRETPPR